MECERCFIGEEARYRVYTDIIDMKVCSVCADKARKIGIAVEVLGGEGKTNSAGNDLTLKDRRPESWVITGITEDDPLSEPDNAIVCSVSKSSLTLSVSAFAPTELAP